MDTARQPNTFADFILSSKPGDKFIYFVGETLTFSILSNEIRKATWKAACSGLCYLVQKKIKAGHFEFWAVKASNPPLAKLVPVADRPEPPSQFMPRLQNYNSRKIKLIERVMS